MTATNEEPLNLAEIKACAEQANPGPWSFGASYEVWRRHEWGARRIATVSEVPNDTEDAIARYWTVEFIANARQWVPALVAELEVARTDLAKAEEQISRMWHLLNGCNITTAEDYLVGISPGWKDEWRRVLGSEGVQEP